MDTAFGQELAMTPLPAPHSPSTEVDPVPETPATLGAGLDFSDPHSPLARYYLSASHVAAAALLAGVFLILCHVPLWHTDIWVHLRLGQWIVEHQQMPARDPFCPFADPTAAAPYPGWLGQ